jgi:hypothetical protein
MRPHALRALCLAVVMSLIAFGFVAWLFLTKGVIVSSTYWTDLAVGVTLLGITALSWGLKPYIARWLKGEKEDVVYQGKNVPMPSYSEEKITWFSKVFGRTPINKESRDTIWLAMIIMIIGGGTAIAIGFNFLSMAVITKTTFSFVVIYTMIGAGALFIVFSSLLMVTQLQAMYKSRQQQITLRKTADLDLINNFKRSFEALLDATQPKTKKMRLEEFKEWLVALCNRLFDWDDEVNKLILDVIQYIPLMLSEDQYVEQYLSYLRIIINSYGKYTVPPIKKKFLVDLEKMYGDIKFETDTQVLNLLMELHEFNEDYMMKIVEDAAYQWSDNRFSGLEFTVRDGFAQMNRRNQKAFGEFYEWLDDKMQDAERIEKDKNEKVESFSRLTRLRNYARQIVINSEGSRTKEI